MKDSYPSQIIIIKLEIGKEMEFFSQDDQKIVRE